MGYIFEPGILQQDAKDAISKNVPIDGGAMYVVDASITEYLMIFGTPLGTEGHTGRFHVDDYFIILYGEQWAFSAGQFIREVYRQGDMHHLARRQAKQYKIPEACWALEYARGAIPTMMPFGLADTFTSTLDFHTLTRSLWLYATSAARELLHGKI
jgi:C-8 sterol isomerase